MILKKIRADFDGIAAKLATRGVEKEKLEKLHDLDIKRRELIVKSEALKLNAIVFLMKFPK